MFYPSRRNGVPFRPWDACSTEAPGTSRMLVLPKLPEQAGMLVLPKKEGCVVVRDMRHKK
ncbi:MAG: hypothetical protein ACPGWR_31625 [Ardenticatenaceae bacterium]